MNLLEDLVRAHQDDLRREARTRRPEPRAERHHRGRWSWRATRAA
jgi:hypothetical protein